MSAYRARTHITLISKSFGEGFHLGKINSEKSVSHHLPLRINVSNVDATQYLADRFRPKGSSFLSGIGYYLDPTKHTICQHLYEYPWKDKNLASQRSIMWIITILESISTHNGDDKCRSIKLVTPVPYSCYVHMKNMFRWAELREGWMYVLDMYWQKSSSLFKYSFPRAKSCTCYPSVGPYFSPIYPRPINLSSSLSEEGNGLSDTICDQCLFLNVRSSERNGDSAFSWIAVVVLGNAGQFFNTNPSLEWWTFALLWLWPGVMSLPSWLHVVCLLGMMNYMLVSQESKLSSRGSQFHSKKTIYVQNAIMLKAGFLRLRVFRLNDA